MSEIEKQVRSILSKKRNLKMRGQRVIVIDEHRFEIEGRIGFVQLYNHGLKTGDKVEL